MNSDLIELLQYLKKFKVRYLIIGGQAVIAYAQPRYTKDLDIWVEPSRDNARRLVRCLEKFGAPMSSLIEDDFSKPGTIFIFGLEPNRVDLLTKVKGVSFSKAYERKTLIKVGRLRADFISREDLLRVKKATGRLQDLIDVKNLEQAIRLSKSRKKQKR